MNCQHIAVVILNYNSEKDLQICAEQVARQEGVYLSIILVDNASRTDSLATVKSWLAAWQPDAVCGVQEEVHAWMRRNPERAFAPNNVYLIENPENLGYSAGNNVGIRLADALNADAVLIANPDMRFNNLDYIKTLTEVLFSAPENCIAASRIQDLQGDDQNPLREPGFFEELFWPRWLMRRYFKQISYIMPCSEISPIHVPKVAGCCMLLKMDFLRRTNCLDENVFLYCGTHFGSQGTCIKGAHCVCPSLDCHSRTRKKR